MLMKIISGTVGLLALSLIAHDSSLAETTGERDRDAIIAAINEIGSAADCHAWTSVREQFADAVFVDYTSLTGGQPSLISADELVAGWTAFLPRFTSTRHTITGHQVAIHDDAATSVSQFEAVHHLDDAAGGDTWILAGHYEHALKRTAAGWKVTAMKMIWTSQDGNRDLPKIAMERAKSAR